MSSPIYLKKNNLKNIGGNDKNIINNSNNVIDSNIVAFSIGNGGNNNASQTSSNIIDGTINVAVNEKDSTLLCDLPDPVWNKMSASNSGIKKRKKQDTKPQSQINKCLNEKRRREQENIFIEELAELISVSFSDMNSLSVKPDKCAILQETVHQIRNIKQQQQQQDNQQHHQANQSNQGAVSTDDIQQGEVSSSKPTVLSNDVFGPLLLEALEGFAFLLDHEAKVDYVTDNVSNFIQFSRDELIGRSIYSIIHPKDHGRFSSCLLPAPVSNWNQNGSDVNNPQSKNRSSFSCRLLVKNPADDTDKCTSEDKGPVYENVQISYTLLRGDGWNSSGGNNDISSECTDMSPGLICVARRIPSTEKHLSTPMEQFTTKLDTNGRIVGIDTSGSSATYSNFLNKELMGKLIQDFCHHQDLPKLNSHLKETLTLKQGASPIFRFKVSADKFVHVKTKSRLFNSQDSDFIMATHSIIDDNDVCQIESLPHLQLLNPTSGSYSGGLMLNASNSRHSNVTKLESSSTSLTFNNSDYQPYPLSSSDLSVCENDFFHNSSSYDIDLERSGWHNRPESGHSLTSTVSPSNQHCQGSPATNPPTTPYATLPFSPINGERKEGNSGGGSTNSVNVATPETLMNDPVNEIDSSQKLRNLLTTNKKNSVDEDANRRCSIDSRSNHDENMDTTDDTNLNSGPKKVMALAPESSSNRMLLELLNNKREVEEPEKHELLQRILQDSDYKNPMLMDQNMRQNTQLRSDEEKILRSIGFSNPSPPLDDMNRLRKRPSEDTGDTNVPLKKIPTVLDSIPSPPQPAVILSRSNLQEKNKMLAELLEKQPTTPTVIPHLPPSIIGATPQDRLPKFSVSSTRSSQDLPMNSSSNQLRVTHPQRQTVALTSGVLHELLQQQSPLPPQTGQTPQQLLQRHHNNLWDTNPYEPQENDPALNDLLDQLFATVPPDAVISATDLIDALQAPEGFSNTAEISAGVSNVTLDNPPENNDQDEKAAINAITRSFMQCEQSTNIKRMQRLPQQIVLQQHLPHQTQQPLSQFQSPSLAPSSLGQVTQQPFQTSIYPHRGPAGILVHQNITGQIPTRSMTPQYVVPSTNPQFTVSYRPNMMNNNKLLQEHQKRLLRQQHQQLVISSNNASVNSPNSSNLQSMDLLNSAVCPPNVALQRSSSISSDTHSAQQPSPGGNSGFGSAILSSPQISPSQRQQSTSLPSPYSPIGHQQQTFAPLNNISGVISHSSPTPSQGSRLSPNLSPFQTQLSPRVSQQQQSYSNNTIMPSQGSQTAPPQQSAWPTQQRATPQQQQTQQQIISSRLNLQQLQNPLLDARLSSTGYPTNFTQHQEKSQIQSPQLTQIRSLVSPNVRQSSFPSDVLPSTAANYAISSQPQQHYRLPRSMGLSSSTTIPTLQIPAGNNNHNGNNTGSEFVRQELRAKVDARMRPPTTMSMEGGQPVDLKSLGLNLEMPVDEDGPKWDMTDNTSTAGLSVRTSLSTLGNIMRTSVAANPTLTSISSASSGEKSSLLQKLLSE